MKTLMLLNRPRPVSLPCHLPSLLLIGGVLVLALFGCRPMQLTPITPKATEQHRPGKVVWHDLLTDDVEAAKRFYGQLFGWTFEQRGRYTLVLNRGTPIAGMVAESSGVEGDRAAWWVVYLSVADVDNTADWIRQEGGRVLQGPGEMAGRGRYAMVADPQGAVLVVLHSSSGDPVGDVPPLGGWLWNELWTTDYEAALTFYQALGYYAAQQASPEEGDAYWILLDGRKQWQAGLTMVPFEEIPPQWVPAVRVHDPAKLSARVAALGGRVLIKPDHPLSDGSVALVEDPSGGIVMMESWHPEISAQEPQQ